VAIVPVDRGPAGAGLAVVEAALTATGLEGTDPSLHLSHLRATPAAGEVRWIGGDGAAAAWEEASSAARWALSAELVAIGHHVIARAVEYTVQRRQYGRPIGSFQALQHRLAGAHASVTGARRAVVEASVSGSRWDAMVAKALAGRAAEDACTQAQQSYGAIGFTWEHELHRFLRRTYVLDWLFGDWRSLEREIGESLLAGGLVPRIGTL
jgi:alkylation response protein AidB-like acyl-CoA dehydrogenase